MQHFSYRTWYWRMKHKCAVKRDLGTRERSRHVGQTLLGPESIYFNDTFCKLLRYFFFQLIFGSSTLCAIGLNIDGTQ